MKVLCTDHNCKFNLDTGYYGVCKKRSSNMPGYGQINRILVETCESREIERDKLSLDEQIDFCNQKIVNIKLKTEPSTFEDILESLEELKCIKENHT